MKTQLSIQEKLWELRKERNLNLEDVAKAVDISPATLSNYENKEYKEISLSLLTNLAKYYQVSLDWLAGLSETREPQNIAISELFLDDATLKLLKNGQFNNRLLCELIKHPHFMKFMLHTEIYVDGLATMQIKNINQVVDAVTLELIEQQNPSSNDLHLNTLEEAHIKEDEYFFHIIHNDLDTILRNIRENHQFDINEYKKFISYVIYRNLIESTFSNGFVNGVAFAVASLVFLHMCDCYTVLKKGEFSISDRIDNVKMWSKQIEYNEENVDLLNAQIAEQENEVANWDANHVDELEELVQHWNMLETGRNTKTGPMYNWFRNLKKKNAQNRLNNQKASIIAHYNSTHSIAA